MSDQFGKLIERLGFSPPRDEDSLLIEELRVQYCEIAYHEYGWAIVVADAEYCTQRDDFAVKLIQAWLSVPNTMPKCSFGKLVGSPGVLWDETRTRRAMAVAEAATEHFKFWCGYGVATDYVSFPHCGTVQPSHVYRDILKHKLDYLDRVSPRDNPRLDREGQ